MRKIPLFVTLCLLLMFAFGCQPKEAESPAPPAEKVSIPVKPTTLETAIQLYENTSNPQEAKDAVEVFNTYAYRNDPEGQYYLGLARLEGKGAQQSDLQAYVWFTIAARQHHLQAMDKLENVEELFGKDDLAEITNQANDWDEKVRNTPEMN